MAHPAEVLLSATQTAVQEAAGAPSVLLPCDSGAHVLEDITHTQISKYADSDSATLFTSSSFFRGSLCRLERDVFLC